MVPGDTRCQPEAFVAGGARIEKDEDILQIHPPLLARHLVHDRSGRSSPSTLIASFVVGKPLVAGMTNCRDLGSGLEQTAVGGKVVRHSLDRRHDRSPPHSVSAYARERGLVLAQHAAHAFDRGADLRACFDAFDDTHGRLVRRRVFACPDAGCFATPRDGSRDGAHDPDDPRHQRHRRGHVRDPALPQQFGRTA